MEGQESWIVLNRTRVQRMLYELEQFEMKDTLRELNWTALRGMLGSAYKEVNRLEGLLKLEQEKVARLKKDIDAKENKDMPEAPPETPQPTLDSKVHKPLVGKKK